jgi:hypothetical protein
MINRLLVEKEAGFANRGPILHKKKFVFNLFSTIWHQSAQGECWSILEDENSLTWSQ